MNGERRKEKGERRREKVKLINNLNFITNVYVQHQSCLEKGSVRKIV